MTNLTRVLWSLLLLSTISSVKAWGQSKTESGNLTIYLRSFSGGMLPASGVLSIYAEDGSLSYSTSTRFEANTRLAYGIYVAKFESTFLLPVSRKIVINRPDCFAVLASAMVDLELTGKRTTVSIGIGVQPSDSCRASGKLWIKLTGVVSEFSAESPVSPRGFALFESLEIGKYIVAVVDGERIRALQAVDTDGPTTVVKLNLSACE